MLFVVTGTVHGNNRALTARMCRDPVPAPNFQVSLGGTEAQPLQVVVDWAEHFRQITPVRFLQAEQKAAVILRKEL